MEKLLKIAGMDMPSPDKYDLKLVDIDSSASGRGDTGYLTRDRVRANVASIDVGWAFLTDEELDTIQTAISTAEFDVEYRWKKGSYNTAKMYAGDRALSLVSIEEDGTMRWSLSFSLIEF